MRRKDWCWFVRAVYVLGKLSDVSGPGLEEAGRYIMVSKLDSTLNKPYVYLKQRFLFTKIVFYNL